ncbi:MAG: hypothetical protein QME64_12915, partial [bacterium]|nr:hypothetical protein [bacterium]
HGWVYGGLAGFLGGMLCIFHSDSLYYSLYRYFRFGDPHYLKSILKLFLDSEVIAWMSLLFLFGVLGGLCGGRSKKKRKQTQSV